MDSHLPPSMDISRTGNSCRCAQIAKTCSRDFPKILLVVLSSQRAEKEGFITSFPAKPSYKLTEMIYISSWSFIFVWDQGPLIVESFFFSCPVSDDFLGPGKKPKYLSSYPYLHLSSWVRPLTPTCRPLTFRNHSSWLCLCFPRLPGSGSWRKKTIEVKEKWGPVSASSQFNFKNHS